MKKLVVILSMAAVMSGMFISCASTKAEYVPAESAVTNPDAPSVPADSAEK